MNARGMYDARELLGVDDAASAAGVRRACASLAQHLRDHGAPTGLQAFAARARDAALDGRPLSAPLPHDLLGVSRVASRDELRAAWRRVAAIVHPDRGGTAGLFRLVADAFEAANGPRRPRRGFEYQPWTPPPKPPPPGPFVAPPAAERIPRRRAAAAVDLLTSLGAGSAWLAIAAVVAAHPTATVMAIAGIVATVTFPAVRSRVALGLWAIERLRSADRPIDDREAPDRFLAECALDTPVGRETHARVRAEYRAWCRRNGGRGLPPWRFVEELRSYGLLLIHGDGAEPRWVGLTLRRDE